MLLSDMFGDAFGFVEMGSAIERIPHVPNGFDALNIFTKQFLRDTDVSIELRKDKLNLIQTSARGEPLDQRNFSKGNIRKYSTVRIAQETSILASELAFTRQFGTAETQKTLQSEVARRWGGNGSGIGLIDDVNLTLENMRKGAIQGKVLDADGSVIINWLDELGGNGTLNTQLFTLTSNDGTFKDECKKLVRSMRKKAGGAWRATTTVRAECGENFHDLIIKCPEVREQYRNQERAYNQTGSETPFTEFSYGGIVWSEYYGVDDPEGNDSNADVSIGADECSIFPVGLPGMFIEAFAPGEKFADIGKVGQRLYSDILVDRKDTKADLTVYSYPLHIVTNPLLLTKGSPRPEGG